MHTVVPEAAPLRAAPSEESKRELVRRHEEAEWRERLDTSFFEVWLAVDLAACQPDFELDHDVIREFARLRHLPRGVVVELLLRDAGTSSQSTAPTPLSFTSPVATAAPSPG